MTLTTIQVPDEQLTAVRDSLLSARHALGAGPSPADAERLLAQVEAALRRGGSASLTGSKLLLWCALYDALCQAAERLADECNEFWHRADPSSMRVEVAAVVTVLDLLESLGPPPATKGVNRSGAGRRGEIAG